MPTFSIPSTRKLWETKGQDAAKERVTIKRAARQRAHDEGFDAIVVVDEYGQTLENVRTVAQIANENIAAVENFYEACTCKGDGCDLCAYWGYIDKRDGSPMQQAKRELLRTLGKLQKEPGDLESGRFTNIK
jgi:hypothetical protein